MTFVFEVEISILLSVKPKKILIYSINYRLLFEWLGEDNIEYFILRRHLWICSYSILIYPWNTHKNSCMTFLLSNCFPHFISSFYSVHYRHVYISNHQYKWLLRFWFVSMHKLFKWITPIKHIFSDKWELTWFFQHHLKNLNWIRIIISNQHLKLFFLNLD